MSRPKNAEMPLVNGQYPGNIEPLGVRHDTTVNKIYVVIILAQYLSGTNKVL